MHEAERSGSGPRAAVVKSLPAQPESRKKARPKAPAPKLHSKLAKNAPPARASLKKTPTILSSKAAPLGGSKTSSAAGEPKKMQAQMSASPSSGQQNISNA